MNTVTSWAPALIGISAQIGYIAVDTIFGGMVRIPLTTQANPIPASSPAQGTAADFTGATVKQCTGLNSAFTTATTPVMHGRTEQECLNQVCSYHGQGGWVSYSAGSGITCSASSGDTTLTYGASVTNDSSGTPYNVCTTKGYYWDVASTSCKYSSARNVADSKRDYQRTTNTLSISLGEVDTSTATNFPVPVISGSPSKLELAGKDTYGNTVQTIVQANSDGGSTVTQKVQTSDSSGNTSTTAKSFTVDNTGNVTGQSQVVTQDAVTLSGTTQTATVASSVPAGSTAVAPSSFPSDYAKSGEAEISASSINTNIGGLKTSVDAGNAKLDQLHTDLTGTSDAPSDLAVPNSSAFDSAFFNGTFTSLQAWRLPSHSSVCPTATFDLTNFFGSGGYYLMDYQCTLAESQRSTLSASMIVVWLLVAFFIVMGA